MWKLFSRGRFVFAECFWQRRPLHQLHQPTFDVKTSANAASAAATMGTATRGGGSSARCLLEDTSQLGCNNGWCYEEGVAAKASSHGSGDNIARCELIDKSGGKGEIMGGQGRLSEDLSWGITIKLEEAKR